MTEKHTDTNPPEIQPTSDPARLRVEIRKRAGFHFLPMNVFEPNLAANSVHAGILPNLSTPKQSFKMNTKPTAGAMRAAKIICPDIGNPMTPDHSANVRRAAEVIDAETGTADLLAACQAALAACEIEFPKSTASVLRAAIAKAEGKSA